jgi:tRNA modification GTPase
VLVARLVELLGAADPGPTSLAARAARALAEAPCLAAARVLLDQAEGALGRAVEALDGLADLAAARRGAAELVELGQRLAPLFVPPRVVLAGPVNAGKSSLFNLLVGQRRVVVSDEPGTTRDRIEARAQVGAYAVELVDTAGDRLATGPAASVEGRGQRAGREERARADLVLWLDPDPSAAPPAAEGVPVVALVGRGDELARGAPVGRPVVAPLASPAEALAVVEAELLQALDLPAAPWLPGRAVPFDVDSLAACGDLARAQDAVTWRRAVSALLG